MQTGSSGSEQGQVVDCGEHVNETSSSITFTGFLDQLSDYQFKIFAVLGCYAASRLQWYNMLTLEDGTDRLYRNVGNKLPIYAAQHRRKTQRSFTLRLQPKVTWLPIYQRYSMHFFKLLHRACCYTCCFIPTHAHTGCPRRNGPHFGRVFLMLKYTDITQNTYVQSWTVTQIMAREVWNFDSCYTLIDYQIHIKTGRNMWFL